ncbi:MAG: hypothetical protein AAGL10_02805 [Pseudomonadota bacterium]
MTTATQLLKSFITIVIATPALGRGKQSRAGCETLWIAASPAAPRNDEFGEAK